MLRQSFTEAWNEPRVPSPPVRVWRDRALVGVFLPAAAFEIALRDGAGWWPSGLVVSLVLAASMLWRRTNPLATMAVAFGSAAVMDIVSRIVADQPLEFYAAALVLIIPYALFRWGSGKEAMIGLGLMIAMWTLSITTSWTGIGDAIGGLIVLLFPAALGDLVRNQHRARIRAVDETKVRERELLARELHDTVAHHVSAIAIQAQAGRAVFAANPDAAMQALATIEEEASRTLVEMRTMVSALRSGDDAERSPQAAFDDIERLASAATALPVTVERSGDLDAIDPAIDRALFRLAQESITNATRHARNATAIEVRLRGDTDEIRLTVTDDGEPRAFDSSSHNGFGLVGMTERAQLLGGSLQAGPTPDRGWRVAAVLPRVVRSKSGAGS